MDIIIAVCLAMVAIGMAFNKTFKIEISHKYEQPQIVAKTTPQDTDQTPEADFNNILAGYYDMIGVNVDGAVRTNQEAGQRQQGE